MRWRYTIAAAIALIACGCFDSGHSAPASTGYSDSSGVVPYLVQFTGTVNLAGGPALPAGAPPRPADHQRLLVLRLGHPIKRVVTDRHGRFTIRVPAGPYTLQAAPLTPVRPIRFLVGAKHAHHRFWMSVR